MTHHLSSCSNIYLFIYVRVSSAELCNHRISGIY